MGYKTGYLRGVRGMVITTLEDDGSEPSEPEEFTMDTPQTIGIEVEIEEGESESLRGGDSVLARIEEDDTIIGVNLSITDAKFDPELYAAISGGSVIEEEVDTEEEVVGYEAPTIEEQRSNKTPFEAKVYVQSHDSSGNIEGYVEYTFPFCKGIFNGIDHGDQEWGTPEFSVKGRENPDSGDSCYRSEFIEKDDLPSDLE